MRLVGVGTVRAYSAGPPCRGGGVLLRWVWRGLIASRDRSQRPGPYVWRA